MPTKRFLIAPLNSGLQNDIKPWLIPDDAFSQLRNMYLFRNRLRKRFGSQYTFPSTVPKEGTEQLFSRLRLEVDTIVGGGTTGNVPGGAGQGAIGQLFSIGNNMFTVFQAAGTMLIEGTATTATFDTATGEFIFAGLPDPDTTPVYWFPALPVMGITQFERNKINDEPTYVFDTRYAYTWNDGWNRSDGEATAGASVWSGNNANFFWAFSWRGSVASDSIMFVSNFNFTDGGVPITSQQMRYLPALTSNWTFFQPEFNTNATPHTIFTARVIIAFKDRLLLMNVVENQAGTIVQVGNRCRFSQNGSPIDITNSFQQTGGRGGFLDAPTQEQIISAEFLRDRLIVFFEKSTWELVFTGNEIIPFRWQKINTELGAESTFSIVPFDNVVLGVGQTGIHACSGASVESIDNKIPDLVFDIKNQNDGLERVHGIRDFKVEQVYWTFPDTSEPSTFPTQVLVFDYATQNWAINDDSITVFGYYQNQTALTWGQAKTTWEESKFQWSSGTIQSLFRQVLAGNQEGYVFIIDPGVFRNIGALQITNITGASNNVFTVVDNNLRNDDYVAIENANGMTYGEIITRVSGISGDDVTLDIVGTGTYTGGGTLARVSNPKIITKQYNFFNQAGVDLAVEQIDMLVNRTANGEFSVNSRSSSSTVDIETLVMETTPYEIYPLESSQDRFWHTIYPSIVGNNVQFRIFLSDPQMRNKNISWSDIEIHGFLYYAVTTSSRFE